MSEHTRKSLADHMDSYDDEIRALQDGKRDMMQDYRAQLQNKGWGKIQIKAEVEGFKVALRRRRAVARKGEEEVDQFDAIADEIFAEITSVARAPRATRENIEEFRPADRSDNGADITMRHQNIATDRATRAKIRTSEAMDDNKAFSAELLAAGLITEEAHAENVFISDGVARKYGAGVVDPETGEITEDEPETATTPSQGRAVSPTLEPTDFAEQSGDESSAVDQSSARFGDEGAEQPEDGLSASGDNSENVHETRSATPVADGGQPSKLSPSAGGAKMGEVCKPQPERAAEKAGYIVAKEGQAANDFTEADVAAFLKNQKEGCLDRAGCKTKATSVLCARCAAERARSRAAA